MVLRRDFNAVTVIYQSHEFNTMPRAPTATRTRSCRFICKLSRFQQISSVGRSIRLQIRFNIPGVLCQSRTDRESTPFTSSHERRTSASIATHLRRDHEVSTSIRVQAGSPAHDLRHDRDQCGDKADQPVAVWSLRVAAARNFADTKAQVVALGVSASGFVSRRSHLKQRTNVWRGLG